MTAKATLRMVTKTMLVPTTTGNLDLFACVYSTGAHTSHFSTTRTAAHDHNDRMKVAQVRTMDCSVGSTTEWMRYRNAALPRKSG